MHGSCSWVPGDQPGPSPVSAFGRGQKKYTYKTAPESGRFCWWIILADIFLPAGSPSRNPLPAGMSLME
ncbi:MAG TPA: hypothetical protein DD727_08055, partial [Clostridiales bacterium]|nr:hypothetical protein [Clostridiales bacterium]